MPQQRKVYLLDPKELSPETIAVTFAKTSRSPLSFSEIAEELSDEKSANFHEKWVVGYGHSSVAEHAVLHIAAENVSRLAVECIESNRLASYTEKSSRYQIWDRENFFFPDELIGTDFEKQYKLLVFRLFDHYQAALESVRDYLRQNESEKNAESDRAYEHRLRTVSADACRYYLPACSMANVGISINARALEHALRKMLSHPLEEVRRIGEEIKAAALSSVPTLVKYAEENPYLLDTRANLINLCGEKLPANNEDEDWFRCIDCDPEGENRVLAALLYRFGGISFDYAMKTILNCEGSLRKEITGQLLGKLGDHDIPLRELEYAWLAFDLTIDQGAYFELKRHRMMTQTPQRLTASLGFAVPALIEEAGVAGRYREDMEAVKILFAEISRDYPHAASYIVPNAFNRRVLLQTNLRSALHFIKLRSAPNAHFAIRRAALRMAGTIQERFPLFAEYFEPKTGESWQEISKTYFSQLS